MEDWVCIFLADHKAEMANPYSRGMRMLQLAREKSNKRKPEDGSVNVPQKKIKSTPKYIHEEFVAPTYSPVHPLPINTVELIDEDFELNNHTVVEEPNATDLLNKCHDILNSFPDVSLRVQPKPVCGKTTVASKSGKSI